MNTALTCSSTSTSNQITVTNLLAANTLNQIKFRINGFKNPISTEKITGFLLVTKDLGGGKID
jgi:hypothetical protein